MTEPAPAAPPAETPADPWPRVPWRVTDALLVMILVMLSGILVLPISDSLGQFGGVTLVVASAILTMVFAYAVIRRRYGPGTERLLWGYRRPTWGDVGVGVLAAVVGQVGVSIIVLTLTLGGRPPEVQEGLRQAASNPATLPLMALGAVLLIPLAEELVYRGMLFQSLRGRYGRWPAIGISGFVFGLLHMQGDLAGTLLLLAAFYPFGMWLAWLFDRRGSLVSSIVCHAIYNGGNLAIFLTGR